MSQVQYNRRFFEDWEFFLHCSGYDLYAVYSILRQSNIAPKDGSYKPEDALKSIFSLRYGSEEMVKYSKFITDLSDDLGIKVTEDATIFKEDGILLYAISKSVKSFSDQELAEFKKRARLTNDNKDAIIRELSAKTRSSNEFRKELPALTSVALGVHVSTASLAALGLGATTVSMIVAATAMFPLATTAFGLGFGLANRKKKSAEQVLPAMAIIIRIRREFLIDFRSADEAIAFLRTTIRTCEYSDKERVAIALLLSLLKKDTSYGTPEVIDTVRPIGGISVENIITEQKTDAIVPFIKDAEQFLCSFIRDNGDSLSVLSKLFPEDSKQSSLPNKESNEEGNTDSLVNINDKCKEGERIAELEKRVERLNRILHGIRHNLAGDFANTLNPYRDFLDTSIPISREEAELAVSIGRRINAALQRAGKVDYGEPDHFDLVSVLKKEFSIDQSYSVEFKDMPNEAFGVFNKLSFETNVLNNIRGNLRKHAFGAFSEDMEQKANRRVQISMKELDGFWTIYIRNNGEPFPATANISEIWDYGRSFGRQASEEGGTGMFYIKDTVEHFGGTVDFVPLFMGDFTVEYRITIKK